MFDAGQFLEQVRSEAHSAYQEGRICRTLYELAPPEYTVLCQHLAAKYLNLRSGVLSKAMAYITLETGVGPVTIRPGQDIIIRRPLSSILN